MTSSDARLDGWRVELAFVVLDFECPHAEITSALGLEPTTTWNRGDLVGKSALRRKAAGWTLASGLAPNARPDEHLDALLSRLPASLAALSKCGDRCHTEFSMAVRVFSSAPPLSFSPTALQRVAQLRATLDIDLILLASPGQIPLEIGP